MNSIVFHGVPQGHDVFGGAGDKYFESLYGISDSYKGAKTVFVVEVRRDVSGLCSYYSYIRPQNVVANSGRSGSYFGMSLKVEGRYCTDVYSLFQLFDKIYEEKILGTIIQRSGNTEQYSISSFADAEPQLRTIAQLADNQVKSNFDGDFEDIDSSFTKQYASASVYYNLIDVNSEAFFIATRIYGRVFVSPEYTSKDAKISSLSSSEKKNQALKIEYEKQISELQNDNAQIPGLKSQLAQIQNDYETLVGQSQEIQNVARLLKNTNSTLEQQLSDAKVEVEKLRQSTNIDQVVERLEPSLREFLDIMRVVKPSGESKPSLSLSSNNEKPREQMLSSHRHNKGRSRGIMNYLPYVLGTLLALLLFIFLWRGIRSDSRLKKLDNEIAVLKEANEKLKEENKTLQLKLDEFNTHPEEK